MGPWQVCDISLGQRSAAVSAPCCLPLKSSAAASAPSCLPLKSSAAASAPCWPPQLFASSQNSISFAFRDCCAARFTTLQRPRLQLPLKGSAAASAVVAPTTPCQPQNCWPAPKTLFLRHVETAAKHISPPFSKARLQLPLKGSAAASAACWLPQLRASLETADQLPKLCFYNYT